MSRKLLLSLCLALACVPALAARWVRVASNDQSVFYLDVTTIARANKHAMIWVLRDHRKPRNADFGLYQSSKDQIEVDCPAGRIRRIYSSDHPLRMGEGQPVHFEHGPMSWNDAVPKTPIWRLAEVACATP